MAKPFISSGERVRSFLLWGFALSLLLHLLFAPFVRYNQHGASDQSVEKVSVTKKIKVKVPTPPPPTPTPKPTPPPKSTPPPKQVQTKPQPQLKLNVPKTSNNSKAGPSEKTYTAPKTGSQNGAPAGQGTAPPGPPSTPGPPASPPTPAPAKCATPYQDATVVNAVPPEYPESAKAMGLGSVVVLIQVTVGPSGSLQAASVYQSSQNSAIDRSALVAARQSTYQPKIVNCEKVAGVYSFRATFDPNQ
ncbi:MAG: TonB family protein [Candidatus Eremiobacteraeota bacterium]|nr:TonB family protein [Candidatus Eremiobacteraeota bacterium]